MKAEQSDGKIIITIDRADIQAMVGNLERFKGWRNFVIADMDKFVEYIIINMVKPESGDGQYSQIQSSIEQLAWQAIKNGENFIEKGEDKHSLTYDEDTDRPDEDENAEEDDGIGEINEDDLPF